MTRHRRGAGRAAVAARPRWSRSATRRPRPRRSGCALPAPRAHLAGQHYVVRLTAPDGYTASRSYSVASAPDDAAEIELTVERLEDGEVSTLPARRGRGRRRARGAGPDRRLVRVGRRHAGAAGRRRVGRRAADGDAAPRPPHRAGPTSSAWSCRSGSPTTSTTRDELPGPGDHDRLHAARRRRRRPGRPGRLTRRRPRRPRSCPTPPPTSAGRPASPTPPATCSSAPACPSTQIRVERFGPTS